MNILKKKAPWLINNNLPPEVLKQYQFNKDKMEIDDDDDDDEKKKR